MITVSLHRSGRVKALATLDLPLPAGAVWGQMRGFGEFVTHDLFHCRILYSPPLMVGARITIQHGFGPFRLNRVGRILKWREGTGYAFSDLSQRDSQRGFPHVYEYQVLPTDDGDCRLTLKVTGRWTLRWMPKQISRMWLWGVIFLSSIRLQRALLIFAQERESRLIEAARG